MFSVCYVSDKYKISLKHAFCRISPLLFYKGENGESEFFSKLPRDIEA